MNRQTMRILFGKLPCLALVALLSTPLPATTLLSLTFEQLVEQSALVFTADVVRVEVVEQDAQVYTRVTFRINEEIKGSVANTGSLYGSTADTLTLRFLGGSTPARQLEVIGQYIPAQGDRGLYFVADAGLAMVNPLTGWSQGYFPLVTAEDGTDYLDLRGHPDYAVALGLVSPLADKMRTLGFNPADIAARFPDTREYPLADFVAAIAHLLNGGD